MYLWNGRRRTPCPRLRVSKGFGLKGNRRDRNLQKWRVVLFKNLKTTRDSRISRTCACCNTTYEYFAAWGVQLNREQLILLFSKSNAYSLFMTEDDSQLIYNYQYEYYIQTCFIYIVEFIHRYPSRKTFSVEFQIICKQWYVVVVQLSKGESFPVSVVHWSFWKRWINRSDILLSLRSNLNDQHILSIHSSNRHSCQSQ